MRKLTSPFIIIAKSSLIIATTALLFSSTAQAGARGYNSTLTSIPSQPIRIEVGLSEDLAARAEGLADGRKHCPVNRASFENGFVCNGYIGQRDLDYLAEKIEKWTSRSLAKKDINVTDETGLTLKLTLVDAQNNRPTHRQLSEQVGLSFQSFGLGGADIEGELFAADGTSLGTMSYSYYETFLDSFSQARGTWTDANRAIQSFSRRLAKDVSKHSS